MLGNSQPCEPHPAVCPPAPAATSARQLRGDRNHPLTRTLTVNQELGAVRAVTQIPGMHLGDLGAPQTHLGGEPQHQDRALVGRQQRTLIHDVRGGMGGSFRVVGSVG